MVGLRREFHIRVGPGRRQIPERASGFAVGRHEVRLGVLRISIARHAVDRRLKKTGRRPACPMGRRGGRRCLPRVPAGYSLWRKRTYDHAEHGNKPFAERQRTVHIALIGISI